MAGVRRWVAAVHPEARDEQRPVERLAVVGDQPAVGGDQIGQDGEQRCFGRVVGQQQLPEPELPVTPDADANEERQRPRGCREAGRLDVQADKWSPGLDRVGEASESR